MDVSNDLLNTIPRGGAPFTGKAISSKSVAKLRQLGFDPIDVMVALYRKLQKEEQRLVMIRDNTMVGTYQKYSSIAHAQILSQMRDIANDLMRYGYGRVPETVNVENHSATPLTIVMTPAGGNFVEASRLPEKVVVDSGEDE
jgi:hypothetical protein